MVNAYQINQKKWIMFQFTNCERHYQRLPPPDRVVVARSVVISNHPAGDTGYLRFRAPEAYVSWQILAQRRLARGGGANHWVYHRKTMGKPQENDGL